MQSTKKAQKEFLTPESPSPAVPGDYPKRRSDISVRVVNGETLVLDRQKSLIHQLNQTASYIWDRCDGTRTVTTIASQLAETFDVDAKTATKDVAAIIGQLQHLHLLESC